MPTQHVNFARPVDGCEYPLTGKMMAAHEDLARSDKVKVASERSFGFVFAAFFLLVGIYQAFGANSRGLIWFGIAAIMLLLALLCPGVLRPANLVWHRFGLLLHRVVNPVILGFLFFGVVTPIGLLMRLFGRRPCQLELERRTGVSYWIARPKAGDETGPTHFDRQF
jgi:hypothetical protein